MSKLKAGEGNVLVWARVPRAVFKSIGHLAIDQGKGKGKLIGELLRIGMAMNPGEREERLRALEAQERGGAA